MPRLSANVAARLSLTGRQPRLPKYHLHKASGQALVTLSGRDYYLGLHGTQASRTEYERRIGEWLASGKQRALQAPQVVDLTVNELLAQYLVFAKSYYRKDGRSTNELENIRHASKPLRKFYGRLPVKEFGPLSLKALQLQMIGANLCRNVINSRIGRIKRIFRWDASEELVPPSVLHGLTSVMGLRRGRTEARETAPVRPAPATLVDATLPHLPPVVAEIGCRPGEVCNLRPCDVDRSGEVWAYRPASHKTEHHGRERMIYLGPKAQAVLLPYLLRDATAYCFSPAESERRHKDALRAKRKSPVQPSQLDRSKKRPKVRPSDKYSKDAYQRAVRLACDKAFPPAKGLKAAEQKIWRAEHRWTPNQLRHAAATEIRAQFGLEAAQAVLGHSRADITQVYAERDFGLAARIAQQVG